MQGIIDSHAHVCGKVLFPRWNEVMERAEKAGLERIMIVCTEVEEAERAIEIAARDPMFDVACGFYPNDILKVTKTDWSRLESLVKEPDRKSVV